MPRVSVVLPVRNGQTYIKAAVKSILNQSFTDFELIVADDGSTDQTPQLVSAFAAADRKVRFVSNPRKGLVATLELARSIARGEFIARMDADDISLPTRLLAQVEFINKNPSVVAVGGQIQIIDTFGCYIRAGYYPISPAECKAYLDRGSPLCHPSVLMRASAVEEAGGYRREFEGAEDYDLWFRLVKLGNLANLEDVVLKYRHHPESVTSSQPRKNAVACALALAANKTSVHDLPEYPTDSELEPWTLLEKQLPISIQLPARQAYIRALVLNGGIARETSDDVIELLNSYVPSSKRNDSEFAFLISRTIYHLLAKRRWTIATRVLAVFGGASAQPLTQELFRSTFRRMRNAERGKNKTVVQTVNQPHSPALSDNTSSARKCIHNAS